jgi:hypothetical protein
MVIYIDVKCFNHLSLNTYFACRYNAQIENNFQGSKSSLSINLYLFSNLPIIHLINIDKSLLFVIRKLISIYRYIVLTLENR